MHTNILLVDDDGDDREIFLSALDIVDSEVKCDVAENGLVALKKLNNGEVAPSLIFLDLNMPMMNGQQVLTQLKSDSQLSAIPVVVLSTASDQYTIDHVKKLGAYQFYSKPDAFSGWTEIIKDVLDRA